MQIDPVDFTGNLTVQGSSDATANTVEWYNVDFQDLATGNTVSELAFTHSTEKLGINIQGYHPYIRLEFGIDNGNIDLIKYR
jgi:hypothetical protein